MVKQRLSIYCKKMVDSLTLDVFASLSCNVRIIVLYINSQRLLEYPEDLSRFKSDGVLALRVGSEHGILLT